MGGLGVLVDFVPDYDATVVARLEAAGAVLLGKLNMTEGAMGGYHRDFEVPLNPWDPGLWPGASSSGSGVATAAGLCFAALGTDTGGSIRFPAMGNGIVGLKPNYGRADFAGTPTLSVPCGVSPGGPPYTIQFMGRALFEPVLCRIGHAYEGTTAWHTLHPDV